MRRSNFSSTILSILIIGCFWYPSAFASGASKMVIISGAQSLPVGSCSSAVTVTAEDNSSLPAKLRKTTKLFFDQGDPTLKIYSDSACGIAASSIVMAAGSSTKKFYFKPSAQGSRLLYVSTLNFVDGTQYETISPLQTPTPQPSPVTAPAAPTISLISSQSSISSGQSAVLTYTSTNSSSCTGIGFIAAGASGTVTVQPSATMSYSLTCNGGGGSASANVTVAVVSSAQQGRSIPSPVYGVTLADISNINAIVTSLQHMPYVPTSRVVFDYGQPVAYYSGALQKIAPYSYIMGQLADSSDMKNYNISTYQVHAQGFVSALSGQVDVWEVGNEVNGNWLGTNTQQKIEAAYDVVSSSKGATAITFFYMGEPSDANNCIVGPGYDMFSWINSMFQLSLNPSQRSAETEKIRLGLNYALISWYPDQCPGEKPDWTTVYNKLANIFPNAKVGFGEIGTATAQNGSQYEIDEINQYYPLAKTTTLPPSYVGGYFWWYFSKEMVPYNTNLMSVLQQAIMAGPAPSGH
jgi:hypothetical protein